MKKLRKLIRDKNLDYVFLCSLQAPDPNMLYFSGLYVEQSFLLVNKGRSILFVSKMEYERAKRSKIKNIKVYRKLDDIGQFLKNKRIGMNLSNISLSFWRKLRTFKIKAVDISEDLFKIRSIKTKGEIRSISKACRITSNIFYRCIQNFKKFRTEDDVKYFISSEALKERVNLAFEPIIASGKNASMPHNSPGKKLYKGFCIIDLGVEYKGQKSDMTRTIHLGQLSKKERRMYNGLLKLQESLIKEIKPGKKCSTIAKIAERELKERMIHGLGHGVGLEIHEYPSIFSKSKHIFENNMAFTIEPGIYSEGKYGIRIEDTVVIEKSKPKILTKATKKLLIIK